MGAIGIRTQFNFRARNDDGTESTATWKAALDSNWTQNVDETFRLRIRCTQGGGTANGFVPTLQYNLNSAGWNDVTTSSSVVRAVSSANVTDEEATTEQIDPGGNALAYTAGKVSEDGQCGSYTFGSGQDTENEFVLQIRSVDVANNDTVQFRVVDFNVELDSYSVTPQATVSESGGDGSGNAALSTATATMPSMTPQASSNISISTMTATATAPSASANGGGLRRRIISSS